MKIEGKIAVVTGGASGIGRGTVQMLVDEEIDRVAMVDLNPAVEQFASEINALKGRGVVLPFVGNATDAEFRSRVYDAMERAAGKHVAICVPAAGITRDDFAVKLNRGTGQADLYPKENFDLVIATNLAAPVYWAMEMARRIIENQAREEIEWDPERGFMASVVFIGSVSSEGNRGQLAYTIAKKGLIGAMEVLNMEGQRNSIRCTIVHPGFTDTEMVRKMSPEILRKIITRTKLGRLVTVGEVTDGIRFLITNEASNRELWLCGGIRLPS